jgi:hypothetical protein
MQHAAGRRSSRSPSSSAGPHAPPLRLCVWTPVFCSHQGSSRGGATHNAGGSVLAAARKSTADSGVKAGMSGPRRLAESVAAVQNGAKPWGAGVRDRGSGMFAHSLRPERSPRASSGNVAATATRGKRRGGPERGQAVGRRGPGPWIWHVRPPLRAARSPRARRRRWWCTTSREVQPRPPPPPHTPSAAGARTQQHALHHGAVLQLHRHRLVRQLHQKPAHGTGGRDALHSGSANAPPSPQPPRRGGLGVLATRARAHDRSGARDHALRKTTAVQGLEGRAAGPRDTTAPTDRLVVTTRATAGWRRRARRSRDAGVRELPRAHLTSFMVLVAGRTGQQGVLRPRARFRAPHARRGCWRSRVTVRATRQARGYVAEPLARSQAFGHGRRVAVLAALRRPAH